MDFSVHMIVVDNTTIVSGFTFDFIVIFIAKLVLIMIFAYNVHCATTVR